MNKPLNNAFGSLFGGNTTNTNASSIQPNLFNGGGALQNTANTRIGGGATGANIFGS